jgi:thiol-disulfide isomerase/thioredoxin|tara:strand:+ start:1593 stop:2120 length:528 start_codon:yes stop_codon:yes gene_type:complete
VIDDKIIHILILNKLLPIMLDSLNFKIHKIIMLLLMVAVPVSCADPDYYLADGSDGSKEDFEGKWLVINYWADWCPPCIKEMPELTEFYRNNSEEVTVLAFNFDELDGEDLEEQIIRFKVDIPSILTNPGLLFGWQPPKSLPATYFIDSEGNFKEMVIGPQTEESLELMLNRLKD